MNRMPFIDVNEWNVKKVSSASFSRFLNWVGKSVRTKAQFLTKYSEYSLCCCKQRWLRFAKDICLYNGLVYDEKKWSRDFDDWEAKNCSYSIHFF